MSKKIFVIEDWEEFLKQLNMATIESVCVVADVVKLLKKYEQEVIEFEGRANFFMQKINRKALCIVFNESEKIKEGDKLQIFVVKKDGK